VYLYLKVAEDCAAEDWHLVSPAITPPAVINKKPFGEGLTMAESEWVNSLPVGTDLYHVDCDTGLLVTHYLRTSTAAGDSCDWINLSENSSAKGPIAPGEAQGAEAELLGCMGQGSTYWQIINVAGTTCVIMWVKDCDGIWRNPSEPCVVRAGGDPDPEALCALPIGSVYIDTDSCDKKVYEKLANNCDDGDWCPWYRTRAFARSTIFDFSWPVPTDVEAPVAFAPDPSSDDGSTGSVNTRPDVLAIQDDAQVCLLPGACAGYYDLVVSAGTQDLTGDQKVTVGITVNGAAAGREVLVASGNPNFPFVSSPFEVPGVWLEPDDCVGMYAVATDAGITLENAYVSVKESI